MKIIALAFTALVLSTPAWAQTNIPSLPSPLPSPNNVPLVVSKVSQASEAAQITKLDVREVRIIPAFNTTGGNGQNLSIGLNNFFTIITPQ